MLSVCVFVLQHANEKPSVIILTDIGGDPDDTQSLRRLLVYSNEFQIKGLIATADNIPRPGYKHQIRTDLILNAIDDYAKCVTIFCSTNRLSDSRIAPGGSAGRGGKQWCGKPGVGQRNSRIAIYN